MLVFDNLPKKINVQKSDVAEHTLSNTEHRIKFEETQVLATTSSYHARLYREAIEIHKHTDNFNKTEEAEKVHKTMVLILKNTKTPPYVNKTECIATTDQPEQATPTRVAYKYDLRPSKVQ